MSESPMADWWCWTDGEPSTFRCRERGHDVRPGRPDLQARYDRLMGERARLVRDGVDPAGLAMPIRPADDLSTSALLRQTQEALAASQADLTRTERERDEAAARAEHVRNLWDECTQHRDKLLADLDEAVRRASDLEQVREELRQARLHNDGYYADYQEWTGEKADLIDRSLALKAELASARTELEQLRAQLPNPETKETPHG